MLNRDGVICDVNTAWRRFAEANGYAAEGFGIGADYLDVVRRAVISGDGLASSVLAGIEGVLRGTLPKFELEYPCHSPTGRRWFLLSCSPNGAASGGAVVVHTDMTERRLAEDRLRESELLLRLAQRAANAGAWGLDFETGRFVASDEALRLHGITSGTPMTHERALVAVHPDDRPLVEAAIRRAKENGQPFKLEFRIPRLDGSVRWTLSQAEVQQGAHGRCLVGLALDITDRKQAEEQLRRNAETFNNLIRNSRFGIYIIDSRFRLLQISAGTRKAMAGIEPLIGRDFAEIVRIVWQEPFASEVIRRIRRTLATGEAYHAPNTTERRGNIDAIESYDWQVERIMLPDGDFGAFCNYYDATPLREAEQALEAAARRKDEFLATLAHELRSPLAALSNALHAVNQSPGQENITRLGPLMRRQVDHLVRLVDDLMEVSRISKGKIELRLEPVALATIFDHAIEASRALIDEAGHRLDVCLPAEPLTLVADPVRLTQVFINLLDNAAKYTDAGGRIELSARREGGEAVIRVRDSGIGIPPEMVPNVFELFAQVDPVSPRSQGGLGIGLNLTRNLVTLHRGSITVASEGLGTGATFVVRLPLPALGRPGGPPAIGPPVLNHEYAPAGQCGSFELADGRGLLLP